METSEIDPEGVKALVKAFKFLTPSEVESIGLVSTRLYRLVKAKTKPEHLDLKGKSLSEEEGRLKTLSNILHSKVISRNLSVLVLSSFSETITTFILYLVTSECRFLTSLTLENCTIGKKCERVPFPTGCPQLREVNIKSCDFSHRLLLGMQKCKTIEYLTVQMDTANTGHGSVNDCFLALSSLQNRDMKYLKIQGNNGIISSQNLTLFLKKLVPQEKRYMWVDIKNIFLDDSLILTMIPTLIREKISYRFLLKFPDSLARDDLAILLPSIRWLRFNPFANISTVRLANRHDDWYREYLDLDKFSVWSISQTTCRFMRFVADCRPNSTNYFISVSNWVTPKSLLSFLQSSPSLRWLGLQVPKAIQNSMEIHLMLSLFLTGLAYAENLPSKFKHLTFYNFQFDYIDKQLMEKKLTGKEIGVRLVPDEYVDDLEEEW